MEGDIPDHGDMSILELPVETLWLIQGGEFFISQGGVGSVFVGGGEIVLFGGHL